MLSKGSKFVALVLMPVLFGLPLAACVTPGRAMTEEEHNCCVKMASHCESSVMPSSHSCCQHPVSRQVIIASKVRSGDLGCGSALLCEVALPLPSPI